MWSKIIATIIISGSVAAFPIARNFTLRLLSSKLEVWIYLVGTVFICLGYIISTRLLKKEKKQILYDERLKELDGILFNEFRTNLLPMSTINWLRECNFTNAFSYNHLRDLDNVYVYKDDVNLEFFHTELEGLKTQLIKEILHFLHITGINTFPLTIDTQIIPRDWATNDPERFKNVVDEIHLSRDSICVTYDKLIRLGRHDLKL